MTILLAVLLGGAIAPPMFTPPAVAVEAGTDSSNVVLDLDFSASILDDAATRNRFATALERIADRVDATSGDLVQGDTTVSLVQFASQARDYPGCAEIKLLDSPENVAKFSGCLRSVAGAYRNGSTRALTRAIGGDTNYVQALTRADAHLPDDAERPVLIFFSDGKHDVPGVPASQVQPTFDRLFGSRAPLAVLPVGMGLDPAERDALAAGLDRLRVIREMPACVTGETFDWNQAVFDSPDDAGNAVGLALQDATCTFTIAPTPVPTAVPAPGAVRGLRLVPHAGEISLAWAPPLSDAVPVADYRVRCRVANGEWIESTEGVSTTPTATVKGLPPGAEYECEVTTVGAAADGPIVTATTAELLAPAAPGKPSVEALDQSVRITIVPADAAAGGGAPDGYRYECSGDGGTTWSAPLDAPAVDRTTVVVGALTNGNDYVCRAYATNASGASAASATSDAVRPCGGLLECNGLLVPVIGGLGVLLLGGILLALVALLRDRQRGHVVAVVDVAHTANLGHGQRLGIRLLRDPNTRVVTGLVADKGKTADFRIRRLSGGRFAVYDRTGRKLTGSGEPVLVIDSIGGRHNLVLHAFATNAASPVASRS